LPREVSIKFFSMEAHKEFNQYFSIFPCFSVMTVSFIDVLLEIIFSALLQ